VPTETLKLTSDTTFARELENARTTSERFSVSSRATEPETEALDETFVLEPVLSPFPDVSLTAP
jgi:hypothetical protein